MKEETDLMIITMSGQIIRTDSSEIRKVGRGASGVRLVRLNEGDEVAAACVVPESEVGENGDDTEPDVQGNLSLQ